MLYNIWLGGLVDTICPYVLRNTIIVKTKNTIIEVPTSKVHLKGKNNRRRIWKNTPHIYIVTQAKLPKLV